MREIKFRGKACGEWVSGSLIVCEDGHSVINYVDGLRHVSTDIGVVPETVGQFTGLRDCKRQEIYEGDILSFLPPRMLLTTRTRIIAPVQYRDDGFFVVLSHCDYSLKYILQRDPSAHVIGNILDNPDLLYNDKQSEKSEEVE